jgi:hypothetical protein
VVTAEDARVALLSRLIDHAPLFLPASLGFPDALAEDQRARESPSGWRGRSAGVDELARARRQRLQSIGSCSFFEPVEELEALGVLPL